VKKNLHFLIYLVLAIVLLLGSDEQRLQKANFLGNILFTPFISSIEQIQSLFETKKNNKILNKNIAQKTIQIRDLQQQLEDLQTVQFNFDLSEMDFSLAKIIGYDGRFKEHNFIIDIGKIKQIKKDYPVISTEGIVGKIITVSQNYAVILPLDHHQFKIGVMLKRNHLQGLLESDVLGNTFMTMIPIGSNIELGDTLQTSDISSIFPKGYPVGKVTKLIQSPNKIFMKAEIETFVKPTCLDQVVILHYEKEKNYEREIHRN